MSYTSTESTGFDLTNPFDLTVKLCTEGRRTAGYEREATAVPTDLHYAKGPSRYPGTPLPAARSGSRPFDETLILRKAVRSYRADPVRPDHLATLVDCAARGDGENWPTEGRLGVELQFVVVAWRVENIAPAVYRYEPEDHCLSHIRPAPDPETDAKEMVLQTEFASAPLIILITGNLAAATAIYGAWGYRQLLLRAGSAGQRMWLASVALGLAGTVFAGFLPRAAHDIAGIDGYRSAGLLAFAAGYEATGISAVANERRDER
jgi:SagB-type dehydrogenase family enzyme